MRRRNNHINKEKVISTVIACAVIFTIGIGIFSVVNSTKKEGDNLNNIVDLNEGTGDVALIDHANDSTKGSEDNPYYNEDEIRQIYDSMTQPSTENNTPAGSDSNSDVADADSQNKGEDTVGVAAGVKADPASGYTFNEESTLQWPVKGEIVLKYSMDSTILFKSLGVYKCNPAISISAAVGTNVGAAADGVVTEVWVSEETGTTVSVAIGGGYVTTYGLLNGVDVKKGDKVVAGQLLGTVSEPTPYYIKEGANAYFKLSKDDAPVNPTDFLE